MAVSGLTDPFATAEVAERLESAGHLARALAVWRDVEAKRPDDAVVRARIAALEDELGLADAEPLGSPSSAALPGRLALQSELDGMNVAPSVSAHLESEPPPIWLHESEVTSPGIEGAGAMGFAAPGPEARIEPARSKAPAGLKIVTWEDLRAMPKLPPKSKPPTLLERWRGLLGM